ncbi:MAG: Gfo/Idh/MocA family oxidoreductase [Crocinitomicaceae bacterium]|jgi:predicted dehydrogenase|tara:strand:- start:7481 stop:8464 length:984 start_codon:yes stop_codon:yes gene_type:complete
MLKIGVAGAGHLGKIHIGILKNLNELYDLVGFYDQDVENAKAVSDKFGVTSFGDLESLIKEVDCLAVITATLSHFQVAKLAVQARKHVFIEKPLTETLEEAKKLQRLVVEADVIAQVGHVERFNPAFIAAKSHLDRPMFIETHRLAQFNPRGTDVPVVLDLMIHDLDIILSVVKSGVKKVSASGVAVISDTHDIANARVEFDNGCVANITASRISLKNMRKTRFFQRDAYISVDFLNKEAEIFEMEDVKGESDPFDLILDLGNDKPKKKIILDKPEIKNTNAIQEELISFHDCVLGHKETLVTIDDGVSAMELAHRILDEMSKVYLK